jgi:hypothetical protein
VPLRGGCPGGTATDPVGGPLIGRGGNGGGAIQLVSEVGIEISGVLDVRGEDGSVEDYNQGEGGIVSGGGAGGSVLLEAPTVTLDASAKILATGGAGGMGCTVPSSTCGLGGVGASIAQSPGAGQPATYNGAVFATGGGGGGGLGRIRINTPSGGFQQGVGALLAANVSTGQLATR